MTGRPAVFLDRDGVLNELVRDAGGGESPLCVEHVALADGAAAAAARLRDGGFVLVCVSNQPAAAKGTVSVQRLLAVHTRVLELLAQAGVRLAGWRLCLHHPAGIVPELSGVCQCRKPAPGMLVDLAAELGIDLSASWMIGDTDSDIAAGRAAGCRTLLVEHVDSAHKRHGLPAPDLRAATLREGAQAIIGTSAMRSETYMRDTGADNPAKVPQIGLRVARQSETFR